MEGQDYGLGLRSRFGWQNPNSSQTATNAPRALGILRSFPLQSNKDLLSKWMVGLSSSAQALFSTNYPKHRDTFQRLRFEQEAPLGVWVPDPPQEAQRRHWGRKCLWWAQNDSTSITPPEQRKKGLRALAVRGTACLRVWGGVLPLSPPALGWGGNDSLRNGLGCV